MNLKTAEKIFTFLNKRKKEDPKGFGTAVSYWECSYPDGYVLQSRKYKDENLEFHILEEPSELNKNENPVFSYLIEITYFLHRLKIKGEIQTEEIIVEIDVLEEKDPGDTNIVYYIQ